MPEAAAAPATVSGERKALMPLGKPWEGGLKLRPASQETCRRKTLLSVTPGGVSWRKRIAGGSSGLRRERLIETVFQKAEVPWRSHGVF
jgi:hypothetical protein